MKTHCRQLFIVALSLDLVSIVCADSRKLPAEINTLVGAINQRNAEHFRANIDLYGMILGQTCTFTGTASSDSITVLEPPTLAPIARGLFAAIKAPADNNWTGGDLGFIAGQRKAVLRQAKELMSSHLNEESELNFPSQAIGDLLEKQFLEGSPVSVRFIGIEKRARQKRGKFIGVFSHTFHEGLFFRVESLEENGLIVEPIDDYLAVDVQVQMSDQPPTADRWYFRKIGDTWKVFGSSNGTLPYIPNVRRLRIPVGHDFYKLHKSIRYLYFWFRISPGNVVQLISFGLS